jgi:crotonobetainyl-CoA:carnitine CoA-transferase CaiB-like acyl-CoA transferase
MKRPFEGITVLDLTHVLAGPFCTYQLALLGARTIKIEDPNDPDCERFRGPSAKLNQQLMGVNYLAQAANKKSLTLNLKTEPGRDVLRKLASNSDVVVENYRAGALGAIGLGYPDLEALNPKLIYCSMTGYGQTGAKQDTTAYDNVIQAASGLMSLNGTAEVSPLKVGAAIIDFASGITAAFAIASALFQRTHTGKGQYIDVAMLNTAMSLITTNAVVNIFRRGELTIPKGNRAAEAGIACYETREGLLMLAAFNPKQHRRLWLALDRPDFAELSSWDDIIGKAETFRPVLRERLKEKTAAEWELFFKRARVPAERVRNLTEAIVLQKSTTPDFYHSLESMFPEDEGPLEVPLTPFSLKHGGAAVTSPPPRLGAHNREILKELGYDDDTIETMRTNGVV